MTPIIVTDNYGKVKIVIGAAGGAKIISAVVNVTFSFRLSYEKKNLFEFIFINHKIGTGQGTMAGRRYQTSNRCTETTSSTCTYDSRI